MSEERILWGVKAVTGVTGPARQRTSHGDDEGVSPVRCCLVWRRGGSVSEEK
jgi:hypothetical protein